MEVNMKKKGLIIGIIAAAAAIVIGVLILCICLAGGKDSEKQLATPTNVVINGTVLSWDAVENATHYVVYINATEEKVTETSFDLSGKAQLNDVICVKATADGYKDSNKSAGLIYNPEGLTQLSAPSGLVIVGTTLSWEPVANATSYVVYIEGVAHETAKCSMNLEGKAENEDKVYVVAKANGYIDSEKSVEKVYIFVIDEAEVSSINNKLTEYISSLNQSGVESEKMNAAIQNVAEQLYKEGLKTSDVEQIISTVDEIKNDIIEFNNQGKDLDASQYVEFVSQQVSKIAALDLSAYAVTYAAKEVALLSVDMIIESYEEENIRYSKKSYVKVHHTPEYVDELETLKKLRTYLAEITVIDVEKISIILDALKDIYDVLEVRVPNIIAELKNLENVNGKLDYSTVSSIALSFIKIKDDILTSVLAGMPSMETFTEALSVLEGLYVAIAPEYLISESPYEVIALAAQGAYSNAHALLSFIAEIDAKLVIELAPYIKDIYDIVNKQISEFPTISNDVDYAKFIGYVTEKTGLTSDEVVGLLEGTYKLLMTLQSNPEEILLQIKEIAEKELENNFKNFDYSILLNDPLILNITNIVYSENKEEALQTFLVEELEISKYVALQEGKTSDDVLAVVMSLSQEQISAALEKACSNFDVQQLIADLGLEDIVIFDLEGLQNALVGMMNEETVELIKDLGAMQSVEDLQEVLAKYFDVQIDFNEELKAIVSKVLAEYGLDINYKEVLETILVEFGLKDIYGNLEFIYGILNAHFTKFFNEYKPLIPTQTVSLESLAKYYVKTSIYSVFGENSADFEADVKDIVNDILGLKDETEIVNIFNDVVKLFADFEFSFDYNEYVTNKTYQKAFYNQFLNLLESLITEFNNTIDFAIGLEDEIVGITEKVEKLCGDYLYLEAELTFYVEKLFAQLEEYKITGDDKYLLTGPLDAAINTVFKGIMLDSHAYITLTEEMIADFNIACREHIDNIVELIVNFDYSFDYNEYVSSIAYQELFYQKVYNLLMSIIDEAYATYEGMFELEDELIEMGEILDKYLSEALKVNFADSWEYIFDMLESYVTKEQVSFVKERVEIGLEYANNIFNTLMMDSNYLTIEFTELVAEIEETIYVDAKEIINLFVNFDYTFDYEKYLTDTEYQEQIHAKLHNLTDSVIDELYSAYNYLFDLEDNAIEIFKILEKYMDLETIGEPIYMMYYYTGYFFSTLNERVISEENVEQLKALVKDSIDAYLPNVLADLDMIYADVATLVYAFIDVAMEDINALIEGIANPGFTFDLNEYMYDEEYEEAFNKQFLDYIESAIDTLVIIYEEVLTLKDEVLVVSEDIDYVIANYFNNEYTLSNDVNYVIEMMATYEYENKISDVKMMIGTVVETIARDFLVNSIEAIENLAMFMEELAFDGLTNAYTIIFTNEYLHDLYDEYCFEYINLSLNYYIDIDEMKAYSITQLYAYHMEEIEKIVAEVQEVAYPLDLELIDLLDSNLDYFLELFHLETELTVVEAYQAFDGILEMALTFDELIIENPELLQTLPLPRGLGIVVIK